MGVNRLGDCASILLVEENPASLVHTASLLQEKVHNVTTAVSAERALKFVKERQGFYHIVMADYHMQDMNIFEFMGRIQGQCLTFMPIVLMADDYNVNIAEDALTKGASFFIQKPLVPSEVGRLWKHILWTTEMLPGASSTKQNKRTFIYSDDRNGKRRKSRTAQGSVTCTESGQKKTTVMRNEHGYYQAPSHFRVHRDWKSLPSNPSTIPPSTNFVGFILEGVQQKLKELQSINALDGTTGNGITNTGHGLIFLERGHVSPTNDCVTGALQVPTQAAGVDLAALEVTQTNGCVTGAHQVPNQEAFGDLARGENGHESIMSNTARSQVGWEVEGDQLCMEGGQVHFPNQEASGDLDGGMTSNGNGSDQLVEEIARAQAQITADDIVEMLRMVNDEEVTEGNSTT